MRFYRNVFTAPALAGTEPTIGTLDTVRCMGAQYLASYWVDIAAFTML
jgi:hypothetical protein